MTGVFGPAFEELPAEIPIFPLTGVLLLPGGKLPMNIFEPRYLNMTSAALAGDRMIGMIQPVCDNEDAQPDVYQTGCVGRLTSFSETEDGRYLITLSGYIRFDIRREISLRDGFRMIVPDWSPYRGDLTEEDSGSVDRDKMLRALKGYFAANQVDANWGAIKDTPTDRLVNALAMMCPFQPNEKQALLEAETLMDRADVMVALLEMSLAANDDTTNLRRN
ncbi:MAG: LON peptidase substrate-binding domain-containing protein [Pseudomonadota bacterium]|nr:LON peptidase substrate-binding domain-containing protein [Pseudomonadota bacterium]